MSITYEVVKNDYPPLWGHYPGFTSVTEAARMCGALDFVAAVEDGVMRPLTPQEEAEYQLAKGYPSSATA